MAKPEPTLRRQLLLLVFMTMVPLLVFAFAILLWVSHVHDTASRQSLAATARALSLALDEQIDTWQAVLASLATSPAFDTGDYATLYRQAAAVTERYGGWIAVSLPSGQQVLNTLAPVGVDLPKSHPASVLPSMRDGAEHVSGLFVGPVAGRLILAVTMPVARGSVSYALHLGLFPEELAEVLVRQSLPPGWVANLVDDQNRLIARAPYEPHLIGEQAPDWYVHADPGLPRRVVEGRALDGRNVYGEFVRLSHAPWTLALSVPQDEFAEARRRPLILLTLGGAVLVAAISLVFFLFAARVTRPIAGLGAAARAVTRGEPLPAVPESHIREIFSLRQVVIELAQKQILLREANHRIKNSLQLVSSILGRQGRAAADEETQAVFREAQAHIRAIARLHERMYQMDQYETVDAVALVRAVCEDIAAISAPRATVRIDGKGTAQIGSDAAGSFALIVAELVTNAVKHASEPHGTVDIRCRVENGPAVVVTVHDSGPGLPPDFDLAAQSGLGLRMSLALASQIGGNLRAIASTDGAAFELRVAATSATTP